MAKLINGNGNPAIYAGEDSDLIAAIMGNQTSITAIGEQFRADQADANTIEVFDGVIITQEGRRIQLDANDVDLFTIPTGTPGDTNYYIIGYHIYTDTDSNQLCETFVQKMEDGTETIPEDTFRGGADEVYISLYRIIQDGLNIDSINLLLPYISNLQNINAKLSHIGMIIHTTTLDTEAKVIAIYGGTSWSKIEGRFLLGQSSDYAINSTGGEATHTLTTDEIPAHYHGISPAALNISLTGGANDIGASNFRLARNGYNTANTQNAGGGGAHNNMPPYKVIYIWERTA